MNKYLHPFLNPHGWTLCLMLALMVGLNTAEASRAKALDDLVNVVFRHTDDIPSDYDKKIIGRALSRHGDRAFHSFEDGGYALLQAARRHGDEVLDIACRVPESARYLVANTDEALHLARHYGDEGILVQLRVPGLLTERPELLTRAQVKTLAQMPEAQSKALGQYLRVVDTPETATKLMHGYKQRGNSLLSQLSKKQIIVGGVITAAMVDYALRDGKNSFVERAGRALVLIALVIVLAWAIIKWLIPSLFKALLALPGHLRADIKGKGKKPTTPDESTAANLSPLCPSEDLNKPSKH